MKRHQYYYVADNTRKGPFSLSEILDAKLSPDTLVWREGLNSWTKYSDIVDFTHTPNRRSFKIPEPLKFLGVLLAIGLVFSIIGGIAYINSKEERTNELIRDASFRTEEDLYIYVDKFYRDLECFGIHKVKPANCIVKFSNMQQIEETVHIHGISMGYDQTDKIEIYINYDSWKHFTKGQKYWVMYHELSHDVLDLDDLSPETSNIGKLMYPMASRFTPISMDTFIEAFHQQLADYLGVNSIF